MATGTGKRLTPTQSRAARRVRQARRRRLIRYGGISAIALVSFIFILGLILPGLPIPQFGGGSGSGDIFETGAADAANTQADATNTQASAANTETQAAPSEPNPPNPPAQAAAPAAPLLPPVPWGVHADTLPAEMYAANLAQGGVVISYNCPDGCPDIVAQLSDIVYELIDADGKVILMPNPDVDQQISLAATGITRSLDGYNEFVIREFIDLIQENSTP